MEILHILLCMLIILAVVALFVGAIAGIVLLVERLTDARRRRNYNRPAKQYPKIRKAWNFIKKAASVLIVIAVAAYFFFLWVLIAIEVCGWIGL